MSPIFHFLNETYKLHQVNAVLNLIADGGTIPFIARYRKEATGNLDESAIADIAQAKQKLDTHQARQSTILKAIDEQGALNEKLKEAIINCYDPVVLEDIYLPYKKRKKTKADIAREHGLEGLAKVIMSQGMVYPKEAAKSYINKHVPDVNQALEGARHIISDWINTDIQLREKLRDLYERHAIISTTVKKGKQADGAKFKDYFDYSERLSKCPSHRFLAILRAESEGIISVKIRPDEERTISSIYRIKIRGSYSPCHVEIEQAIEDAYKRLLAPSLENQVKQNQKIKADEQAIEVFALNLRQLLMSPPLGEKNILALDPGFRTGCKLVCLDPTGDLIYHSTIFPHPPQYQQEAATEEIHKIVSKFNIEAIAVGDGTAGRETITWLNGLGLPKSVGIHLVNESGASIYSASAIARQEFPEKDITVRGAVSIGRRLQDPLAELIKIDAKSIGVGQYQHDVNQSRLTEKLDHVVMSCVNQVGVNLNTASTKLLSYVSGLGTSLAENIVKFRTENGGFIDRKQLKSVPRLGPKAFEQSSGFLRIRDGKNPLDNSAVHPESYNVVKDICKSVSLKLDELIGNKTALDRIDTSQFVSSGVGQHTIKDILKELAKPGLDIRGEVESIEFREDVKSFDDLHEGMILNGIVKNITNFGAFVDIGIKEAGLVHISEISNTFIKHPNEILNLNEKVNVKVIGLDAHRGRVQLSIKQCQ